MSCVQFQNLLLRPKLQASKLQENIGEEQVSISQITGDLFKEMELSRNNRVDLLW